MDAHPEGVISAADYLELLRRLKAWARQIECGAADLVGDLAEIHAAASAIISSIEFLASVPPPGPQESGKTLVSLNAWINDELTDHIESLNAPLDRVIRRVYEVGRGPESSGAPPA